MIVDARGPCRYDPEQWFPEDKRGKSRSESEYEAKRVCARCPFLEPCREHGLAHDEPLGIWGGLTSGERGEILLGNVPPPGDGTDGRDETVIARLIDGEEIPGAARVDIAHALVRLWHADAGSVRVLAARLGVPWQTAHKWTRRSIRGLPPIDPTLLAQRRAREARREAASSWSS